MRLTWLTDIHLDFVTHPNIDALCEVIRGESPDAVLIGGDIAVASTLRSFLEYFANSLEVPIYFVLGNHDYYGASIRSVRADMAALSRQHALLHWLPDCGVVRLTPQTSLIGHGGWGDGRCGDVRSSTIFLNDYLMIDELRDATRDPADRAAGRVMGETLIRKLEQLGDEAAACFERQLSLAVESSSRVFALTHVPPFHAACWYDGRLSDDNWAPHFVCESAGRTLERMMLAQEDCRLTVLCGHTHGAGHAQILPNLDVMTAGADYGAPAVQRTFDVN